MKKVARVQKVGIYILITALILLLAGCNNGDDEVTREDLSGGASSGTASSSVIDQEESQSSSLENHSDNEKVALKTGDIITFGQWHDKPIEWRVLDVQDDKSLIITEDIIDVRPSVEVWVKSPLRTWLNSDFLNQAFSAEEQSAIQLTTVNNPAIHTVIETPFYDGDTVVKVEKTPIDLPGCEDTEDRIFCLSIDEATTYFKSDPYRIAELPLNAEIFDSVSQFYHAGLSHFRDAMKLLQGIDINSLESCKYLWSLRSPGTYVFSSGYVYIGSYTGDGEVAASQIPGVRPALWLQTNKNIQVSPVGHIEDIIIGIVKTPNDVLNVREAPSTESNIIGTLYDGDEIIIRGEESGFYCIDFMSQKAYVSKDFVTAEKTSDSSVSINNVNFQPVSDDHGEVKLLVLSSPETDPLYNPVWEGMYVDKDGKHWMIDDGTFGEEGHWVWMTL